ncbi:uncharacterized protein CMU_037630 [Cryptosporidium muris RN66]|uniref:DUF676 domain-containing protein n=1 Tax=Cryptosporidium muris (strain RN66) TaxID=441375 RepID=B6A907_CRYMR|nr:uncharacterized protein CMU_037630 [Cryptosporidium muris RN66]EEA04698.1 hypothetical protein, conserved [Cryptosporidium muris RN66]|eukprot:XP_002139047.1 hypothetical protein [Cryptosporidium muris RN66]
MELHATINVAINLCKFRNIDLLQNGYYRLMCRLYYVEGDCTYGITPTKILHTRNNQFKSESAEILEDGSSVTSPILIKYIDDIIDINETILFSSDIPLYIPPTKSTSFFFETLSANSFHNSENSYLNGNIKLVPFFLEVDLLYSEMVISDILGTPIISCTDNINNKDIPLKIGDYSSVSYNVYKINNVSSGIVEYIPIIFDEYHFCHIGCIIMTQITGLFISPVLRAPKLTKYYTRYKVPKSQPQIPSFLLLGDTITAELGNPSFNSNLFIQSAKSDLDIYRKSDKRTIFTIRGIILQKIAQISISEEFLNKKNNISELVDKSNNNKDNDKADLSKLENNVISIDEVFPSVITRDPMFLECSRLRLELVSTLTYIFIQLAAHMKFIISKCCSTQRLRLMGSLLSIPYLELPGGTKINVEPLIDLEKYSYVENGATVPFVVVKLNENDFKEMNLINDNYTEWDKLDNDLETISPHDNMQGFKTKKQLTSTCCIRFPNTIWSLTPLFWQLNYKRGITPPLFRNDLSPQYNNIDYATTVCSLPTLQSYIKSPYGIEQYGKILLDNITDLSQQITNSWDRIISIFPFVLPKLENIARMEYIRKKMYLWNEVIFIETLPNDEMLIPNLKPLPPKFPEFIGNGTFPITPPSILSVNSSPTEEEIIKQKSRGTLALLSPWIIGSQKSTSYFMKPVEYHSKIAEQLRNDSVFKSIPSPTLVEEICLSSIFEDSNDSIDPKKTLDTPISITSSKYNEWLPIIFIQQYSESNTNKKLGGILVHCGQACRVGLNNDPIIKALNIVDEVLINDFEKPTLTASSTTDTRSTNEVPVIPIIEQKNSKKCIQKNFKKNVGVHIMIFVHGFQGTAFDMRNVRNIISLYYPEVLCLLSTCNEELTDEPIEEMGKRLSSEIIEAVTPFSNSLEKLSFVGHSLGGLIIRAALPYLKQFKQNFFLFWTLSTPHLGYLSSSSKLVNVGVWLMKKWKNSPCLTQLTLSDSYNIEETYLYKLAIENSHYLSSFKYIVFCSSHQDMYAPYDSARAECSPDSLLAYKDMVKAILKDVDPKNLTRIDVNFYLPQKNLDTFIGRAAHIQVIESQIFVKILVTRFPQWFI